MYITKSSSCTNTSLKGLVFSLAHLIAQGWLDESLHQRDDALHILREKERENLLPHLKWRGTRRPHPWMSRMARLTSMSAANLGVIMGHTHSTWVTLTRSQHAGDGGLPYTTGLQAFTASSLSCLHWVSLNACATHTSTTTITNKTMMKAFEFPISPHCTCPTSHMLIHLYNRSWNVCVCFRFLVWIVKSFFPVPFIGHTYLCGSIQNESLNKWKILDLSLLWS